ncbi:type I restriction endonuclease subunit R [Streptomyces inhibens]|uniref:type I restriction endonuclease subunit R n=1 Tax=Streptomyces inhibens TaxID=2293571 RepID=UPI001EE6FE6B|nr:HsdR family type I site-specific deoxyribonuclease [Streptomyces inhibens]UKY49838.1 HsdR family type I site-specific deoxyribonuclease [Streptomyces inhibens]
MSEASTVQAALIARLVEPDMGWTHVPGRDLARLPTSPMVEGEVREALIRLNPAIAKKPSRVDEVLPKLRALFLAVSDDGLFATNRQMLEWLRGQVTHRFVGTRRDVPVHLIDYSAPHKNSLIVSNEVVFVGADTRRYDIVLWVNGLPLVIGETKTPVDSSVSWFDGANEVHSIYETRTPSFFVPNVFSFATEGKELRYGAIGQPAEHWLPWASTADPIRMPSLQAILRSAELLLRPELILEIINTYTFFTYQASATGTVAKKVIPRYPQVEAVEGIVTRARDPLRDQGLVWHHQGSGKTLLMAFAAAKLRQESTALDAPTIVVVLDRLDLFEQLASEFRAVGVMDTALAESAPELRKMLTKGRRGVIVTTVFRFANAGVLSRRSNIIVLVDEAHRTQDGRLGRDLRAALPKATRVGLTGTPISIGPRDTWDNFGHPDDPGHVLSHYSVERSIADGATLPVHVETRLVDFHIDAANLNQAFAELAAEEGISDEQQSLITRKAGTVASIMASPNRIAAVAADIVRHYRAKIAPLGLKAQVVAYDRAMCVAYQNAISELLGEDEECTVVMTCRTGKDDPDPEEWWVYDRDRAAEAKVKQRFRDPEDPLKILIVTAKLLTGFDAPAEGVIYLDKPLRAHTLFQAITRPNRRWTNPVTGQEKLHGLVVDYVGLGKELAAALKVGYTGRKKPLIDVEDLYSELAHVIATALARFDGIDRTDAGFATLQKAQERLATTKPREGFAKEFIMAQGLFEFLWPAPELRTYEPDYRWLAKIYASIQPSQLSDKLLWMRLGAKTQNLIARHIGDVRIDASGLEEVVLDAGMVQVIQQLDLGFDDPDDERPITAAEVLDSIAKRLARKLAGITVHPLYESLAERLEQLRQTKIIDATQSVEYLKRILELARDVARADRAEREGRLGEVAILPDPRLGALTQIFLEYQPDFTPRILESVIEKIDALVLQTRYTGWQASQPGDREVRRQLRVILKEYGLPPTGALFDRAYAYIAANY